MAFSLFGNLLGKKGVIGLDIGTASIKLVELAHDGGRFNLLNYGIFELSNQEEAIETSHAGKLPEENIVAGIKELLTRANIKSKKVIASVPSFSTFSTVLSMSYLSEKDLAKTIPLEAKKYIPIPLEEVDMDWTIIDTKPATGQGTPMVDVFLVAMAKAEKEKYKRIIQAAGLELISFDLESIGLIRSLLGNDLSPMAVVNIGGRSSSIMVVDRGYERINHNYEIGGFEITRSIARSMGVNLARAEELKRSMGLLQDNKGGTKIVSEAMRSLLDMIAFETQKTITNYETGKTIKVQKVFLVGGMANMPGLADYIKGKLQIDVSVGNAFARVVFTPKLQPIIAELAPTLAIATGVAMREVNI
ncbi:MAG: hypothetical protein A3I32_01680 [Candidatus Yanofskybacteria bacterium RIFCSPLOWO2_02_FULL_45_10]|uniref:SHS2 domain-containing protein n=2 Tax=Candidatus Yanofskyibacteriota TaxID=1752733 RepID=A0A1F8G1X1_9BACT|nr:MAG: hypothetical protein A3F25_01370 [Candidatus Yanofskybacteria bacterium RIFCSPHIGHO2_12_FULL_45_19b]OGN32087.1 MAG: hypothetical protein A3I32_01680 [Candidatus Yanofskybacteria bacterium RIFCSPLOWO2_02_FULL_45_10]